MKTVDKKVISAITIGLMAVMTTASVVMADTMPDISEKVEMQETCTLTDDYENVILNKVEAPNKIFKGWSLTPEKDGVIYKDGDKLPIGDGLTLYPVWEDVKIDVKLNDESMEVNSGENKKFSIQDILADENGIDITNDAFNISAESSSCETVVKFKDIQTEKDVESDGNIIYPELEDASSSVGMLLTYEVDAINEGKIIGKSDITVPVMIKGDESLFNKDEKPASYTVVDENGEQIIN